MTASRKELKELIALTKSYLAQEFSPKKSLMPPAFRNWEKKSPLSSQSPSSSLPLQAKALEKKVSAAPIASKPTSPPPTSLPTQEEAIDELSSNEKLEKRADSKLAPASALPKKSPPPSLAAFSSHHPTLENFALEPPAPATAPNFDDIEKWLAQQPTLKQPKAGEGRVRKKEPSPLWILCRGDEPQLDFLRQVARAVHQLYPCQLKKIEASCDLAKWSAAVKAQQIPLLVVSQQTLSPEQIAALQRSCPLLVLKPWEQYIEQPSLKAELWQQLKKVCTSL
jgi:hypothetical protein